MERMAANRLGRLLSSVTVVFLAAAAARAQGVVVRPEGAEGAVRIQVAASEGRQGFGPLEDGKEESHADLVKEGWVYLFDSRIPAGRHKWDALGLWRVRNPDAPDRNHWSVAEEDGQRVLRNTIGRGDHGTDLISLQELWNFDIHAEFRAPSNSGLYLRGRYEVQINSTPADPARKLGKGDLAGIYNVSAPSKNASKGPEEWQTFDVRIRGFRISVWLNGELVQDKVEIPEDWRRGTGSQLGERDGVSGDPGSPGPIFLQGDHGTVEFRNIRVRPASRVMPLLRAQPGATRAARVRIEREVREKTSGDE